MRSARGRRLSCLGVRALILLAALLWTGPSVSGQERTRREPGHLRSPAPGPIRKLHQDPPGCNENAVGVDIVRDPTDPIVPNGSTVNYTVTLENIPSSGGIACHATNMTVSFTCPGPTGSPNGAMTELATNLSLSAGTTQTFPPVPCMINVNPGVTSATARADFIATVHLAPVDDNAGGFKTITVVVQGPTDTPAATETPTVAPTDTPTPTETETPSPTPTFPPATSTFTSTQTPSPTPTETGTPTFTSSPTSTPTWTPSQTPSPTPTATSSATSTPTASPTRTPSAPVSTATTTPTATITSGGPGGPGGPQPSAPIPTLSAGMLVLLGSALAGVALLLLRRL